MQHFLIFILMFTILQSSCVEAIGRSQNIKHRVKISNMNILIYQSIFQPNSVIMSDLNMSKHFFQSLFHQTFIELFWNFEPCLYFNLIQIECLTWICPNIFSSSSISSSDQSLSTEQELVTEAIESYEVQIKTDY